MLTKYSLNTRMNCPVFWTCDPVNGVISMWTELPNHSQAQSHRAIAIHGPRTATACGCTRCDRGRKTRATTRHEYTTRATTSLITSTYVHTLPCRAVRCVKGTGPPAGLFWLGNRRAARRAPPACCRVPACVCVHHWPRARPPPLPLHSTCSLVGSSRPASPPRPRDGRASPTAVPPPRAARRGPPARSVNSFPSPLAATEPVLQALVLLSWIFSSTD